MKRQAYSFFYTGMIAALLLALMACSTVVNPPSTGASTLTSITNPSLAYNASSTVACSNSWTATLTTLNSATSVVVNNPITWNIAVTGCSNATQFAIIYYDSTVKYQIFTTSAQFTTVESTVGTFSKNFLVVPLTGTQKLCDGSKMGELILLPSAK